MSAPILLADKTLWTKTLWWAAFLAILGLVGIRSLMVYLDELTAAASIYVQHMKETDQIGVVAFSSNVQEIQPLTSRRDLLYGALESLRADGATAFYDAVYDGVRVARGVKGRRIVLAMTDGIDNASWKSPEGVVNLARRYGVPVYTIGLGARVSGTKVYNPRPRKQDWNFRWLFCEFTVRQKGGSGQEGFNNRLSCEVWRRCFFTCLRNLTSRLKEPPRGGEKMARLEEIVEIANPQHPHCAVVLLLDISGSMQGEKIDLLSEGLRTFKDEIAGNEQKGIKRDDLASKRVDLAVVTFGNGVNVIHDFSGVDEFEPPTLTAEGSTPMGEAILKGIDLIENRKQEYKAKGVDYYRPWLFLLTDGQPTDMQPGDSMWHNVVKSVHDGEDNRKFVFFAVAVEPGELELLRQISHPKRPAVRLKGLAFRELFVWLSKSQAKVSGSKLGEQVALDPITGWAQV